MKKTLKGTLGRTNLEGDPLSKAEVHWRKCGGGSLDGGGQGVAWARADPQSPGKQKTNLPGPSELRLVSRHTEVVRAPGGCERRVCRIRVRRAQSLRLPALGVWPGKWATRCPHISTPVISHAEGARTHKTLRLAHYARKPGRRSFLLQCRSTVLYWQSFPVCSL